MATTDDPQRKRAPRQVDSISYGVNGAVGLAPCVQCEFWHAEVIADFDDQGIGEVLVREWHEGTCPVLDEWPDR